jgi:hypothetical protein
MSIFKAHLVLSTPHESVCANLGRPKNVSTAFDKNQRKTYKQEGDYDLSRIQQITSKEDNIKLYNEIRFPKNRKQGKTQRHTKN